VVFTSTVVPFAYIEDTDVTTWLHAFTVNAVGANNVLRAALPYLSENGVVLITSSHDVGRPRAGVSAYSASKAALDEILHSWRGEHPELSIVRVGVGPTADTEILRGADRDLLSLLFRSWVEHGQLPAQMSALRDVANMFVSLVNSAHANPSVVPEIVQLSPRIRTTGDRSAETT
jgi:NAD(P)-dependent dehydrogenase (short-subunit alcohol dehydrogenase family)